MNNSEFNALAKSEIAAIPGDDLYSVLKVHSVKLKRNDCKIQTNVDNSLMSMNYDPPLDIEKQPFLTDIVVIGKNDMTPAGYHRLESEYNLTKQFFCVKKGMKSAITDIIIIYPNKQEKAPRGYKILMNSVTLAPVNLNEFNGGPRALLCTCTGTGPPVIDFLIQPNKNLLGAQVPYGYIPLTESLTGAELIIGNNKGDLTGQLCLAKKWATLFSLKLQKSNQPLFSSTIVPITQLCQNIVTPRNTDSSSAIPMPGSIPMPVPLEGVNPVTRGFGGLSTPITPDFHTPEREENRIDNEESPSSTGSVIINPSPDIPSSPPVSVDVKEKSDPLEVTKKEKDRKSRSRQKREPPTLSSPDATAIPPKSPRTSSSSPSKNHHHRHGSRTDKEPRKSEDERKKHVHVHIHEHKKSSSEEKKMATSTDTIPPVPTLKDSDEHKDEHHHHRTSKTSNSEDLKRQDSSDRHKSHRKESSRKESSRKDSSRKDSHRKDSHRKDSHRKDSHRKDSHRKHSHRKDSPSKDGNIRVEEPLENTEIKNDQEDDGKELVEETKIENSEQDTQAVEEVKADTSNQDTQSTDEKPTQLLSITIPETEIQGLSRPSISEPVNINSSSNHLLLPVIDEYPYELPDLEPTAYEDIGISSMSIGTLLLSCYTHNSMIIIKTIKSFIGLLQIEPYFIDVSRENHRRQLYDVLVEHITNACCCHPSTTWNALVEFYKSSITLYTEGISNRSLFLLFITIIDMYLALCRNNPQRIDDVMKDTITSCVTTLFLQAQKDVSKIPYSCYDFPHDITKVYTLMIGQSPLSYDFYKLCNSICDALLTSQINKNCLFITFELISLLSEALYYNDDVYDILCCRTLAMHLLANIYSLKSPTDSTKYHLMDVLPCYQILTHVGVVQALLESVFVRPEYNQVVLQPYMELFTTLWNYREYALYDCTILFKATTNVLASKHLSLSRKLLILRAMDSFFETPQSTIEIFMNFDMLPQIPDKLLQRTCNSLSSLIENSFVSADEEDTDEVIMTSRELALSLLNRIQKVSLNSLASVSLDITKGWAEDETVHISETGTPEVTDSKHFTEKETTLQKVISESFRNQTMSFVRTSHNQSKEIEKHYAKAMEIAKEKESLKKGLNYLITMGVLHKDEDEIVNLFRLHQDQIDDALLGDYLGEGGDNTEEEQFYKNVREIFMKGTSYAGIPFVEALRMMLTQGGFKLPGEGQKIERFVDSFSKTYYNDNPNSFEDGDVCMVLAFSVIMLNTDAHNQNVRKDRKMKKEEFVKQNRGINNGKDLPREMLEEIYDTIVNNEIKIPRANPMGGELNVLSSSSDLYEFEMVKVCRSCQAVLKAKLDTPPSYNRQPSPDVARLIAELLIPIVFPLCDNVFHIYDKYRAISANLLSDTTDLLVNSICTCLFLGDKESVKGGANILKSFEQLVLFEIVAQETLDNVDWYTHVTECSFDIVFDVISMFQTTMFQFKYLLEKHIRINEAQQLRNRFAGDLTVFTATRKLVKEGELFLIYPDTDPVEKESYTYFVLDDRLLVATKNEKSGKFNIVYDFKTDDIKVEYDETKERQFTISTYSLTYMFELGNQFDVVDLLGDLRDNTTRMRTHSCAIDELEYHEKLEDYKPVIAKHLSKVQNKTRQTSTVPCIKLDAQVKFVAFETAEYEKLCTYAYNNLNEEIFPYYYRTKYGDHIKGLNLTKYSNEWMQNYQNLGNIPFEKACIKLLLIALKHGYIYRSDTNDTVKPSETN